MKVKAKFKGQDGSHGYANGIVYDLVFTEIIPSSHPYSNHIQIIQGKNPKTIVYYQSLRKFLDNWEIL